MIPNSCIAIETDQFPILPGEEDEVINEGMYGKALSQYLEAQLPHYGIIVNSFCPEDWGWWVEVESEGFQMGLCLYSDPEAEGDPQRYAILPSVDKGKKWSWSKFGKVDVSAEVLRIMDGVAELFTRDQQISAVSRHDDFPL